MSAPDPVLVVLAAGASRRLGTCKALVDLGGRTALERLLAAGRGAAGDRPLVVAGADAGLLSDALPEDAELALNPRWREGRTGSVAVARRARPGRDLLIAPVDVPLVPADVFASLRAAWREAGSPPRGWLAPATRVGRELRTGHPIVAGRELLEELAGLDPDTPLRRLRERADPVWRVEVPSRAIVDDLDTPADLKELRARLAAEE